MTTSTARVGKAEPDTPDRAPGPEASRPARASFWRCYRFELVKLFAQWRTRVLVLTCWTVPGLFVAVVSVQTSLPADTLFGRWMHATGWAGPLVVLGFAGTWALPLLTSLVVGDVFASEGRLGTWRHLLVVVGSPRRIFLAKTSASLTVVVALMTGLLVSSVVGGLLAVGGQPMVGLDGHQLGSGRAAAAVGLAWLLAVAPTLALASVGLLGAVALGRSPVGLMLPAIVALGMQVALQLPLPVAVRFALPGNAFTTWSTVLSVDPALGPLLTSQAVSALWALAGAALAFRLFLRHDFSGAHGNGDARSAVLAGGLPLAALLVPTVVVLAVTGAGGEPIRQEGVERSLATTFAHLYRLQTRELHRPDVDETALRAAARCTKAGNEDHPTGPGNDWRCVVTWHLPDVEATGSAIYQLDISPDGRFVADGDGPKEVNGYFPVRTPVGSAPNPLWQFDSKVGLLPAQQKG